jgi:hypothetical protein
VHPWLRAHAARSPSQAIDKLLAAIKFQPKDMEKDINALLADRLAGYHVTTEGGNLDSKALKDGAVLVRGGGQSAAGGRRGALHAFGVGLADTGVGLAYLRPHTIQARRAIRWLPGFDPRHSHSRRAARCVVASPWRATARAASE